MTDRAVLQFAAITRLLCMEDRRAANKLLRAVSDYALSGECSSNAEEDSVCGRLCPVCNGGDND